MFGYINVYKPELKIKDYLKYRGYYCGLCQKLQEQYGMLGKMTLSYDMTFLIVLLSSLYEPETLDKDSRCIVHPIQKRKMLTNEVTEYAAAMNIVLMYYKFMDDWKDDKNPVAMAGMRSIHGSFRKIADRYPEKCNAIRKYLVLLDRAEKQGEENIDKAAGYFGKLMEELFAYKQDIWEKELRKTAFYLGKYIYILDAYDDIEEDIKNDKYNPLKSMYRECDNQSDFKKRCEEILSLMMSDCAMHYEKLPCVENADILNNIIYIGAWNKFDANSQKKGKKCNE